MERLKRGFVSQQIHLVRNERLDRVAEDDLDCQIDIIRYGVRRSWTGNRPSIENSQSEDGIGLGSLLNPISLYPQVHRGRLREGRREVAVKVQHPGSEALMMQDLRNHRNFAAFLQKFELPFDLLSVLAELEHQVGTGPKLVCKRPGMNALWSETLVCPYVFSRSRRA